MKTVRSWVLIEHGHRYTQEQLLEKLNQVFKDQLIQFVAENAITPTGEETAGMLMGLPVIEPVAPQADETLRQVARGVTLPSELVVKGLESAYAAPAVMCPKCHPEDKVWLHHDNVNLIMHCPVCGASFNFPRVDLETRTRGVQR